MLEHRLLSIQNIEHAIGLKPLRYVERIVSSTGSNLKYPLPRLGRKDLSQAYSRNA
jgi:hypothetical protein